MEQDQTYHGCDRDWTPVSNKAVQIITQGIVDEGVDLSTQERVYRIRYKGCRSDSDVWRTNNYLVLHEPRFLNSWKDGFRPLFGYGGSGGMPLMSEAAGADKRFVKRNIGTPEMSALEVAKLLITNDLQRWRDKLEKVEPKMVDAVIVSFANEATQTIKIKGETWSLEELGPFVVMLHFTNRFCKVKMKDLVEIFDSSKMFTGCLGIVAEAKDSFYRLRFWPGIAENDSWWPERFVKGTWMKKLWEMGIRPMADSCEELRFYRDVQDSPCTNKYVVSLRDGHKRFLRLPIAALGAQFSALYSVKNDFALKRWSTIIGVVATGFAMTGLSMVKLRFVRSGIEYDEWYEYNDMMETLPCMKLWHKGFRPLRGNNPIGCDGLAKNIHVTDHCPGRNLQTPEFTLERYRDVIKDMANTGKGDVRMLGPWKKLLPKTLGKERLMTPRPPSVSGESSVQEKRERRVSEERRNRSLSRALKDKTWHWVRKVTGKDPSELPVGLRPQVSKFYRSNDNYRKPRKDEEPWWSESGVEIVSPSYSPDLSPGPSLEVEIIHRAQNEAGASEIKFRTTWSSRIRTPVKQPDTCQFLLPKSAAPIYDHDGHDIEMFW